MNQTAENPAKPLNNVRILITRPESQASEFSKRLESLGASTSTHPVTKIVPPDNWQPVDDVISQLEQFDWVGFVSANGVKCFFDRLAKNSKTLTGNKVVAIGQKTADQLVQQGAEAKFVCQTSDSQGVLEVLITNVQPGEKVLLVRANRGSQKIPEGLAAKNISFQQIAAYQSVDIKAANPRTLDELGAGGFDWVTITSSAIAQSAIRLFGDALHQTKIVSISPTTSAVLDRLGFEPTAEAKEYNMDGLVDAILKATP